MAKGWVAINNSLPGCTEKAVVIMWTSHRWFFFFTAEAQRRGVLKT